MRRGLRLAAPATLALAALVLPSIAVAGGPSVWTNISKPLGMNSDYPGVLRDNNGDLRVLSTASSGGKDALYESVISPAGALLSDSVVVGPTTSIAPDPQLIRTSSGYLAAVGADAGSCAGQVCVTTSSNGVTGWTSPVPASADTTAASDSGFDAVFAKNEPVFAYAGVPPTSITYHVGIGGADQSLASNDSGALISDVTLAVDKVTGDVWAAWYQYHHGTGHSMDGYYVREIYPTVGTLYKAPNSYSYGTTVDLNSQRVPLATPATGGAYLAYCEAYSSASSSTCGSVVLWRAGPSATTLVVPGTRAPNAPYAVDRVGLSAGPAGRLWVAWNWPDSSQYRAIRTNVAKTRFGAIHVVALPRSATGSFGYSLNDEGSPGHADLVAELQSSASYFLWQTQVLAGLTVTVAPGSWNSTHARIVTIRVTDVGDPVRGARVTIHGKAAITGAGGTATFGFPKGFKPGSYGVQASMVQYSPGMAIMRVT